MIGQFKLTHMTLIWPTSQKREQGKKEGYYRTADYRIRNRLHTAKLKVVRNVRYLLCTLLIQISKTKLVVKNVDVLQIWQKIFRKL